MHPACLARTALLLSTVLGLALPAVATPAAPSATAPIAAPITAAAGHPAAEAALSIPAAAAPPPPLAPGAVGDDAVLAARQALQRKDRAALAAARSATQAAAHPLAGWVDYWELGNRLAEVQQRELDAFYARWPGSYVEDRLRNDWLLELGRRRDWGNFRVEYPRFRMNDDREVSCYALLARHLDGQDVRLPALAAWYAQRDHDDGCALLAQTLAEARVFTAPDIWHKARLSMENSRPKAVRAAVALISPAAERAAAELLESPTRFLTRRPAPANATEQALAVLALMRLASSDPEGAANLLQGSLRTRLAAPLAATAWAHAGKQAALRQMPQAADFGMRAWQLWDAGARTAQDSSPRTEAEPGAAAAKASPPWSDELLAWQVRAALRLASDDARRWPLVQRAVAAMSPTDQREPAWVYWNARAALALAKPGAEGDAERAAARQALDGIAGPLHFYGQLAADELGRRPALPAAPAGPSEGERQAARSHPGLQRALLLIALGLRNEGVREWNFSLRGLPDRELLAAAQLACDHHVWDRCINTSERTRAEVDVAQRYPLPLHGPISAKARSAGLEPALLLGLIRQESRFLYDTRSHVGASGLMQLMPATARWMARKVGLEYRADQINEPEINLHLGAAYLRRLVDDFNGSLPMATAAYNAGPGRPRRWREGPPAEPAAWAESIPFNETRDYVKKVLSNAVVYTAVLGQSLPSLKQRLGPPVGPRDANAPQPDRELP